jgi:hypothetical protein
MPPNIIPHQPVLMNNLPCGHRVGQTTRGGELGTPFFHYHCGCMLEISTGPGGGNLKGLLNVPPTDGGEGPDPDETISPATYSEDDDQKALYPPTFSEAYEQKDAAAFE